MTLERKIAGLFKLTDENWMKHANPMSVWTRYSVLPIIVLAFWSRVWIGWWSVIPVIMDCTTMIGQIGLGGSGGVPHYSPD